MKELWDVTFVMDKGHILGTYAREELANEDLEELFFKVTGGQKTEDVEEAVAEHAPDNAARGGR